MITILFYLFEIIFSFFVLIHIMCLLNLDLFYYFPFLYDLPSIILLIPLFSIIVYIALTKSISVSDKTLFFNFNFIKKNKKESPIFRFGSIFLLVYCIFTFLSNKDYTIVSVVLMASLPAYKLISGYLIFFYFGILRCLFNLKKHKDLVAQIGKSSLESKDSSYPASIKNSKYSGLNKIYFHSSTIKFLKWISIILFSIILFLIIEHLFKLEIEKIFPTIYIFIIILIIPLIILDPQKEIRFYKTKEKIHFYKKRNVSLWISVVHSLIILLILISFALSLFLPAFNIISIKSAFLLIPFYTIVCLSRQISN